MATNLTGLLDNPPDLPATHFIRRRWDSNPRLSGYPFIGFLKYSFLALPMHLYTELGWTRFKLDMIYYCELAVYQRDSVISPHKISWDTALWRNSTFLKKTSFIFRLSASCIAWIYRAWLLSDSLLWSLPADRHSLVNSLGVYVHY